MIFLLALGRTLILLLVRTAFMTETASSWSCLTLRLVASLSTVGRLNQEVPVSKFETSLSTIYLIALIIILIAIAFRNPLCQHVGICL